MKKLVIILAIALAVLHQDFWWWDDTTLVGGFMPISLAYHAVYSVAAGLLAWMATKYAWPADVDALEDSNGSEGGA